MKTFLPLIAFAVALYACSEEPETPKTDHDHDTSDATVTLLDTTHAIHPDSVAFSFVFVGCNRVGYSDQYKPGTNASSANLAQLQRTWQAVCEMNPKPDLFFFLGDLVMAEANLDSLNNQLPAWVAQYNDATFSPIKASGIEMIAVPGNHEMLTYSESNDWEYPLAGATETWSEYMGGFMPSAPVYRIGVDSLNNSLSYSFTHKNTHFVVMNTDTYNEDSLIGITPPPAWIDADIAAARANPEVDHIFLLGHKPSYVGNAWGDTRITIDSTLTKVIWPAMEANKVEAMLSAHNHQYCRSQPTGKSYQIIAGNGGSQYTNGIDASREFYGYSVIYVLNNGKVHLQSMGRSVPRNDYMKPILPGVKDSVRDAADISWGTQAAPFDCQ